MISFLSGLYTFTRGVQECLLSEFETGLGWVGKIILGGSACLSSSPWLAGGKVRFFLIQFFYKKGASADAGPHYQKLYGRVTTLVAIAEVSPSEVQCEGLTLEETPP